MSSSPHSIQIRVYYADTDCGNVVYYANYLRYTEAARTEFLRERGIDLVEEQQRGYIFAVTETKVKYRASARYNDLLSIETKLMATSSILLTFENAIYNQIGTLLVHAETTLACIGAHGRAARIPAPFLNALTA